MEDIVNERGLVNLNDESLLPCWVIITITNCICCQAVPTYWSLLLADMAISAECKLKYWKFRVLCSAFLTSLLVAWFQRDNSVQQCVWISEGSHRLSTSSLNAQPKHRMVLQQETRTCVREYWKAKFKSNRTYCTST